MSELDECKSLGAYDCLINALLLWMRVQCLSSNPFSLYNWDFHTSATKPYLFGGTIHISAIQSFMKERHGVEIKEIDGELPVDEPFIMALDAYWLPYIEEFYGQKRQPHFVVAVRRSANCDYWIQDPYYRVSMTLTAGLVKKGMVMSGKSSYRLRVEGAVSTCSAPIFPYLLDRDYENVYRASRLWLAAQTLTFESWGAELKEVDSFKKCFSCLRGVTRARERYFESLQGAELPLREMADARPDVIGKWLAVEKNMIRMTIDFTSGYVRFLDSLDKAFEHETTFLKIMETIRRER